MKYRGFKPAQNGEPEHPPVSEQIRREAVLRAASVQIKRKGYQEIRCCRPSRKPFNSPPHNRGRGHSRCHLRAFVSSVVRCDDLTN